MPDDAAPPTTPTTDPATSPATSPATGPDNDSKVTLEAVYGGGIAWLGRWSVWWLAVVAAAVVLGIAVQYLWSILLPVVLALVLTSVLLPPSRWLERRFGLRPALSAAAMVLAAVAAVALLFVFLVPTVGSQVAEIADSASDGLATVQDQLRSSDLGVTQDQIDSVVVAAQDRLQASGAQIAAGVLVGVGAVTNGLINLLVMLVLSFFFLKDGRRFLPWLTDLGGPTAGMHAAEVSRRSWETLSTFVRTQALVGLIDGVLIGAGLLVVGVPLALPLAVLTFVAAFAPIVGAVTVGILAVLVALVSNGWVAALIIAAVVLAVQQLEGNVLLPYLQGKSLDLHPAVVLLSIILGSTLFGVVGAFLSVPVVAVLAVVLRYLRDVARSRVAPISLAGVVPEPTPRPGLPSRPESEPEG